jgi:hypothetical protein
VNKKLVEELVNDRPEYLIPTQQSLGGGGRYSHATGSNKTNRNEILPAEDGKSRNWDIS